MKIITFIAETVAFIMISTVVYCAEYQGSIHVSAYVVPAAKYEIHHQQDMYTVTGTDVDNGYIDIANALSYSVWTNSQNGYLLTFAFDNRQIKEIDIIDTYRSYVISNAYQEIHMPHPGMKYESKVFNLRLYLLADTKPGTYQIPLAVAINAM